MISILTLQLISIQEFNLLHMDDLYQTKIVEYIRIQES